MSGISNLWKKDKDESIKTVTNNSNMGLPMQTSKIGKNTTNKVKDRNINNPIKSRTDLSFKNDKKLDENSNIIKKNKILVDNALTKSIHEEKVLEKKPSFRKIEFKYPEWKPQLEVSSETKHLSESEKDLYRSIINRENNIKTDPIVNIDA